MKKLFTFFAIYLLVVFGLTGLLFYQYNKSVYYIEVDGEDVALHIDDVADVYQHEALKDTVLKFPSERLSIRTSKFATLSVFFEEQSFIDYFLGKRLEPIYAWSIDKDLLMQELDTLQVSPTDAYISMMDDGTFAIVPETSGHTFNTYTAAEHIASELSNFNFTIDLTEHCVKPIVKTTSLKSDFDKVSWVNDFNIKYTDGTTLSAVDFKDYWSDDYVLNLSDAEFDRTITSLEKSYTTTNSSMDFTTTSGNTITPNYITYGIHLDESAEIEFIKDAILKQQSIDNRKPVLYGYDDFDDTYIEISIHDQHVWHYVNGELCCESDCVTGTKDSHDTPLGVFYVSEKIPGKYLRGRDYVTWVNRWMRLTNSGVGLHDAYWRSTFGNEIYTYNGSHGCINLPPKYARSLYDEISRGIPVVIYYE